MFGNLEKSSRQGRRHIERLIENRLFFHVKHQRYKKSTQGKPALISKRNKSIIFLYCFMRLLAVMAAAEAFELPPVEPDAGRLSQMTHIFLKGVDLEGNTIFSDNALQPIIAPYLNRDVRITELQELRNELTRYYVVNGYINSGAVIHDQEIRDGRLAIRIIEGKVVQTVIYGNARLRSHYIGSRIASAAGGKAPLNMHRLRERLKIVKQDRRIKNIHATIKPGLYPGEAVLELTVEEARPYEFGFRFSNHNAPSIGSFRKEVYLSHFNLTGWGDSVGLQYGMTGGLDDYDMIYSAPVTRWDTRLILGENRSIASVVLEPYDQLDIKSDTTTHTAGIEQSLFRTSSKNMTLGVKLDKRKGHTRLLNESFTFTGGGESGRTKLSVLRCYQEWVDRSTGRVFAFRSTFSFGLGIMDATVTDEEPDAEFVSWKGQFQWLHRLRWLNSQILISYSQQWSHDPLLTNEAFAIGGSGTVRGYRENELTTDNGVVASLEWRMQIFNLRVPYLSKKENHGGFQIAPFIDFGKGWQTQDPDPKDNRLSSIGLASYWSVNDQIRAELQWGYGIESIERSGESDLQDDGIHFSIQASLF